jgi:TonB family protein
VAVAGAELSVPGSTLRAVTDLAGTLRIVTRTVGMISARVGRLGYRTASIMLPAAIGEPAAITLTLVPDVPLRVVVARSSSPRSSRAESEGVGGSDAKVPGLAYRRAIAGGHVFTRVDLERRNPSLLSDILRSVPGLQFRTGPDIPRVATGGNRNRAPAPPRCTPSVWIDGVRSPAAEVDVDNIPPHTLEAVEVYSGSTAIPSEFRDTETRSACGAVLLWSRREGGESLRNLRPPVIEAAPGRLEEVVAQRGAYTATVVDSAARLDEGSIRLVYPAEARNAAGGGTVVAEFVVDTTGRVVPELIRVVGATNGIFAEAARWAIQGARFRPAVMGGARVPQLVQHVFRFENDWRY